MSDKRFEDLEVRLAYQDQLLNELNDVVTRQQASIDRLERRSEALLARLQALGETAPEQDETPPHY